MNDPLARKFLSAYQEPLWRNILRHESEYLREELSLCRVILNVGCGVGALESSMKELPMVGLDISLSTLVEAKKGGGDFAAGDARTLCFKRKTFDAVIFVTALEFMDDCRAPLEQAAHCLTEGGKLIAMMLNPHSRYFRERAAKENSYFNRIKLLDPTLIIDYASSYFDVEAEYFLGVEGEEVFDSSDETLASLYVVKGRRLPRQGGGTR